MFLPVRPCIVALVHVETSVTLIYVLGVSEARVPWFLSLNVLEQLLGSSPGVCKKVQMELFAGQSIQR